MNKIQTNKLRMYVTIQALLKTTTETSGIAGLPAKLTTLGAKIDELNTLATTQTQLTEGHTARRDELLGHMTDTALDVANAVATHATEQNLRELAPTVDVNASHFDALRLLHRPWLAQRIHDAAASVVPDLAPYGVTADTLTDLQSKIDAVRASLDQPRSTITAKKAATDQMAAAFAEVDTMLTQVDRLVFPLRKTSPEFYAQYQAARSIDNVPGTRSAQPPATAPAQLATNTTTAPAVTAPVADKAAPASEQKAA